MKKLLLLIASGISLNAFAQSDTIRTNEQHQYCAKTKDGKIVMTNDGKELADDVVLIDGTKITIEGIIIKPDRSRTLLNNGECVNETGNIVVPKKEKEN